MLIKSSEILLFEVFKPPLDWFAGLYVVIDGEPVSNGCGQGSGVAFVTSGVDVVVFCGDTREAG